MKKVLSLILAMAMVLSFAPQIFAADTGASAEPDITFLPGPAGSECSMKVEAYNSCTGVSEKANRIRFYFREGVWKAQYTSFAIRIKVLVNGKYTLSVNAADVTDKTDTGYADVFMAKVAEDRTYTDEELVSFAKSFYKLGEYDGTGDAPVGLQNVEYNFEQGDYLVVFFSNEKNEKLTAFANGIKNYIASITLTKIEEEIPETVTAGVLTNYKDAASGVTASGYTVNSTKQVEVGTKITAEAKDTEDYRFVCWKVGGAFLQSEAKVENYVVNTNTSLMAVYEPINTTSKIVEFWNANKQFLSMDDDSDGEITEPTAPAVTGFTLTGNWLVDEGKYLDVDSLEAGTTRAVAEVKDTKNAITGDVKYAGEKVSEEHIYGTKVTRTVSGAKYWTRDGKPIFFGETYTYFMWDGTEIAAYADEKTAEPVIILDDPANGAYMIEYCVPEGFTKVEAGILFGKSGKPEVTGFSSKAATQSADAHGQFTAQADDDETVVRGYLIYQVDGEKKIIYTDVYTGTAE